MTGIHFRDKADDSTASDDVQLMMEGEI